MHTVRASTICFENDANCVANFRSQHGAENAKMLPFGSAGLECWKSWRQCIHDSLCISSKAHGSSGPRVWGQDSSLRVFRLDWRGWYQRFMRSTLCPIRAYLPRLNAAETELYTHCGSITRLIMQLSLPKTFTGNSTTSKLFGPRSCRMKLMLTSGKRLYRACIERQTLRNSLRSFEWVSLTLHGSRLSGRM